MLFRSHLHVELFKDDFYLNPASYLPQPDFKGEIQVSELELIPLNSNTFIDGKNQNLKVKLVKNKDTFEMKKSESIKLKGITGFSISAYESSGRTNRIGFQKINIFLNDTCKNAMDLDDFVDTDSIVIESKEPLIIDNLNVNTPTGVIIAKTIKIPILLIIQKLWEEQFPKFLTTDNIYFLGECRT